jgi:hypothetical protein
MEENFENREVFVSVVRRSRDQGIGQSTGTRLLILLAQIRCSGFSWFRRSEKRDIEREKERLWLSPITLEKNDDWVYLMLFRYKYRQGQSGTHTYKGFTDITGITDYGYKRNKWMI